MGQRRTIAGTRMLITGASQGIGRALAETAAAAGARVLAAARQEALLQELAQQVRAKGGIIETVQADVSSAADRLKMVEAPCAGRSRSAWRRAVRQNGASRRG
jgi:NAD(P)-dependent dehydrogenase (short-subunit alcohol dehydrogenase family)